MIKFNMMGSSIQSVQFLTRPNTQDSNHNNNRKMTTVEPEQEQLQEMNKTLKADSSDKGQHASSKHPIRHFYVRRKKKSTENKQKQQDLSMNDSSSKDLSKKKRKANHSSDKISGQSLRRSTRLTNKNKGYKNRSILDCAECNSARSIKKRKLTSPGGLREKIVIPTSTEDFPGLDDIEKNEPFPEISTNMIQKVAVNRCGISPLEVTTELLLARQEERSTQQEEGSGNRKTSVNNE